MGTSPQTNNEDFPIDILSNHQNNKIIIISSTLKDINIDIDKSVDHHHNHDRIIPEEVDEDDDGFKTPTGAEHRIPPEELRQCPPAPRKTRSPPQPIKRRRVFSRPEFDHDHHHHQRKTMRVSNHDVDLLFPPRSILVKDVHRPGSIKKAKDDLPDSSSSSFKSFR